MRIKQLNVLKHAEKGFVAVASMLVVAAVMVTLTVSITLLSVGDLQSAFSMENGDETLSFIDGCVDDALLMSRENFAYTGGNITRPEGTCSVNVSKAGDIWTYTITTTATDYARTVIVVANWSTAGITLNSWSEI